MVVLVAAVVVRVIVVVLGHGRMIVSAGAYFAALSRFGPVPLCPVLSRSATLISTFRPIWSRSIRQPSAAVRGCWTPEPLLLADRVFHALPGLLRSGDLLVLNDTRVMKARFFGEKASGGKLEILVERVLGGNQVAAHLRVSKKPAPGDSLALHTAPGQADGLRATLLGRWPDASGPLFRFVLSNDAGDDPYTLMERHGHMPLPPYIARQQDGADPDAEADAQRYQTVFATNPGAIAAPTAALHFDEALLAQLEAMGVQRAHVTLHVGAGTFQPVKTDNLAEHRMHSEWYQVPQATQDAIAACQARGGRVVAVGHDHGAHAGELGRQRRGQRRYQHLHHAGLCVSAGGCVDHQLPPAQVHAADADQRVCRLRAGDGCLPPRDCAEVPVFQLRRCDVAGARRALDRDFHAPGLAW